MLNKLQSAQTLFVNIFIPIKSQFTRLFLITVFTYFKMCLDFNVIGR